MASPETFKVMQALMQDGFEARFVGGCVRDALANRKVTDIDIATVLTPDAVIKNLVKNEIAYAPTGLAHGTVTAIVDGRPFEITTLRIDVKSHGRHADVKFTDDWQADAARRDFTINAMSANMEGDVYDFFGGMEDLRLGRVVFVGDAAQRLAEDVLRILRFFRFHAHFGHGAPDRKALEACVAAANQLPKLSPERIRQETLKLLEADNCAAVWRLMLELGVVTHFLPEATNIEALQRLTLLEKEGEGGAFSLRRLAVLLDVTPSGLQHVAAALRLSGDQTRQILQMVTNKTGVAVGMEQDAVKRDVYALGNDAVRSLLLLDAARTNNTKGLRELCDLAASFRPPRFPLTGDDAKRLGWKEGPDIGFVLKSMEAWWVDQTFRPTRSDCLEKMKAEFSPR